MAGFCPWNPNGPNSTRMLPSAVYAKSTPTHTATSAFSPVLASALASNQAPGSTTALSQAPAPTTASSQASAPTRALSLDPAPTTALSQAPTSSADPTRASSPDQTPTPDLTTCTAASTSATSSIFALSTPVTSIPAGQPTTSNTPSEELDMPAYTPRMLKQYEAVFLTDSQVVAFEQLFSEKNYVEPNPVYQSWLPLKLASLPTVAEALHSVI